MTNVAGAGAKSKINSFLYGKNKFEKPKPTDSNLKQIPIPPRKHQEKKIKYNVADTQPLPQPAYNNYIDEEESDINPPIMEFTN